MESEGSKRVVERVAAALDRIGNADQSDSSTVDDATNERSDDREAVTDGGADEAPSGEHPWAADDPIVFGDDSDAEHGAAILEAVTDDDSSAPPFESDSTDDGPDGTPAGEETDETEDERLDELEARIGALESDHVQLESQMTDVASAVADLRGDVDRVGEDVLELVTVLGGIALATQHSSEAARDTRESDADSRNVELDLEEVVSPEAIARHLASELEDVVGSSSPRANEDRIDEAIAARIDDVAIERTDVRGREDPDPAPEAEESTANVGEDADALASDAVPEGIHRGVEEVPEHSDTDTTRAANSKSGGSTSDRLDAAGSDDDVATDQSAGQPSRELVDPRSDAVGARLRQFREGFVDDPTADLPMGAAADEFRFEKVLLPTDGEAAPDLSAGELEKPYLESLPDGYAADAVVLEWLDWLVSAADGETAARSIVYYESIGWLTDDARDELLGYLEGLGEPGEVDGTATVAEPPSALDLQDHLRSLQYVTELATGEVDADGI